MEICRFPVVQKPLERVPLPPRVRSNSMSRTLPSSPSLEELLATDDGLIEMNDAFSRKVETSSRPTSPSTNSAAPMATKVTKVVHRNIKMKMDPSTSTTAILPSPSSPGGVGSFIPLPLPSIVPLHHQANHPFIVCPPLSSSTLSSSAPSPSSPSSTSMPTTRQAPFFVPVSAGGSPGLVDPHILHGHQLSRSASASPVPGSTGDQAKKSADSKKRPRSASTPSGSNSEGSSSAARSKRKRKTPEQLALLEKEFETNPMPNKDVREHLSQNLGLTSRQVQIWFQNKRAKVKNNRVSVPGGSQSPEEASSPEGSPSMNSPLMMDSPSSSSSSTSSSFSLPSSVSSSLSSSYPAPSSPSAFQQFSSIDSFFEPSYFDLLLDAPATAPTLPTSSFNSRPSERPPYFSYLRLIPLSSRSPGHDLHPTNKNLIIGPSDSTLRPVHYHSLFYLSVVLSSPSATSQPAAPLQLREEGIKRRRRRRPSSTLLVHYAALAPK